MKKDYLIASIVGFVTGILALRIFVFLNINFAFREIFFLLGIPILWVFGIWLGEFLGRFFHFFSQFGKFAVVGFLGAAIDFSILNAVSQATGITAGVTLGWINIPGFLAAVLNNYFWNKLWVFKSQTELETDPSKVWVNFPKFFGVTLIGLFINSSTIVLLTLLPVRENAQVWLNISKVIANALAMVWNFIGYKFIAFKK